VLHSIFTVIIDTIGGIFGGVFLLRFWMQVLRVRPPNSVAQFTFQLSDWLVRPLRRLLPGIGGYDWASLISALLVAILSIAVDILIFTAYPPQVIFLLGLIRFFQWVFYGLMGLIFIEIIFSWINPNAPLAPFVRAMNEPLLRPLRRIIPPLGKVLDLTPMLALLLLRVGLELVMTGLMRLI
jgi:YggT family protein